MARPLRLQYPGALYHVTGRGAHRSAIFAEEGAKAAFLECLAEASEKAGWKLHAFVVMANEYHLALETPEGNLSEGMRWLQSTYANRFNRYRRENGHVFQGRYNAIVVEDTLTLGTVAHYIHLNPVRTRAVPIEQLSEYPSSSYWMLTHPKQRLARLEVTTCLIAAGNLKDDAAGRRKYAEYLVWLNGDGAARKQLTFEKMGKGWALGSAAFKKDLARKHHKLLTKGGESMGLQNREALEQLWEILVEKCLKALKKEGSAQPSRKKAEDWKIAIAAHLKATTTASNPWLTDRLQMGVAAGVSRYVGELRAGKRRKASKLLSLINTIKV